MIGCEYMGDKNDKHKIEYKRLICVAIIVSTISFFTSGTYAIADDNLANEVKQALKTLYVDDLPNSLYDKTSINDILMEINKKDPFTKYYSAIKYNEVIKSIDNDTSGLGIYLEMNSDGAKVISMNDITPERNAGLMVGDIIVMADGHILVGATKDAALRYIRGNDSGIITLKIKRGTSLMILYVNRQHTSNYAIETHILDNHIGYIKINSFSENGGTEFNYIIKSYQKKRIDRYIIDLRFNTGGFIQAATDIAGYFIGTNVEMVSKSKFNSEKKYYAKYHGILINRPVIFLVNKYTASAAEMLTAAVKDYKKAYIIGTKTFGKGSIQYPDKLSNGSYLKLTIERFSSPKGNPIDKVGVVPDLVIDENVDALKIAELIMDSQQQLSSKQGSIKLCYDDKTVVLNATKAISQDYWQAFTELLKRAKINGSVSFWNITDWKNIQPESFNNFEEIYFHNYDIKQDMTGLDSNKAIELHFNTKIIDRSINSKNIELVDSITGERVKTKYITDNNNDITVAPLNDLSKGYTYYLVVNPGILKANNVALGKGFVFKVITNS